MPNATLNRRQFLASTSAAAAGSVLGFPVILRGRNLNEKLNVAVIACGGRGAANLDAVKDENVVALCDVDARALHAASKLFPQAKTFVDFRKLYDGLKDSEFDAVVVSTPEHTHAFATMPALKRKKHVYCEKPLTRDVHEARLIQRAAKDAGVATQMGTQIHAGSNYRRVVELVQGGAIGPVTEVYVWVSRTWGRQTEAEAAQNHDFFVAERPTTEDHVPKGVDWDLWIGPAPYRPFNNIYFPGPKWYRWWDFGNGTMSDLGSHWNDLPFWALKLDAPKTIEASGPPPHAELAPASMSATYEYGPRGDLPAVKMTWHQGQHKPKIWTDGGIPKWNDGVLFVGSEGRMLLADYGKHVLLPAEQFKDFKRPKKTIPESVGHHAEWIAACKTGSPTTCHFGYAGPLTEANHLGNVAYRSGMKLEWDAANIKFPNAPEAERFLRREYRKGWSLQ